MINIGEHLLMLTAHLDIFLCKYLSVMFLFFFSTDFRSSLYILEMSLIGCVCVCVQLYCCICISSTLLVVFSFMLSFDELKILDFGMTKSICTLYSFVSLLLKKSLPTVRSQRPFFFSPFKKLQFPTFMNVSLYLIFNF